MGFVIYWTVRAAVQLPDLPSAACCLLALFLIGEGRNGEEKDFIREEEGVTIAPAFLPQILIHFHCFLGIAHWLQMFYGGSQSVKPGEVS